MSESDDIRDSPEQEPPKQPMLLRRLTELASVIAMIGASLVVIGGIVSFISPSLKQPSHEELELRILEAKMARQTRDLDEVRAGLRALTTQLSGKPAELHSAAINANITEISDRLDSLEKSILDSPEKALSVPLLRQNLESFKQGYLRDSSEATREIDRIYDQNKWFIGLMFSMAIGLVGLGISNFVQARRKV